MPPSGYDKKELCAKLFEHPNGFSVVIDLDQFQENEYSLLYRGLRRFVRKVQEKIHAQSFSEIYYVDGSLKLVIQPNNQCIRETLVEATKDGNDDILLRYCILTPWAYSKGYVGQPNWRKDILFVLTYEKSDELL
jgi:hypothetical protein